jgi:hypothetical protein
MGPRLNIVFLGCGAITAARGRTLAAFGEDVRCFYASRDAEKAMALERRLHGSGSFGSYAAALANGRMDAVFVATPPARHLELVLEALAQGKDVIVEKPAFLRVADYDRVLHAQARSGRLVLVAENYCYKPLAASCRPCSDPVRSIPRDVPRLRPRAPAGRRATHVARAGPRGRLDRRDRLRGGDTWSWRLPCSWGCWPGRTPRRGGSGSTSSRRGPVLANLALAWSEPRRGLI